MDESNAAPVQITSEASDNINTQQSNGSGLTADQVAQYLGTDKDTLDEFTKFTNANGKFNKAFSVFKSRISNPDPTPAQPAQQTQPEQQDQPVARPEQPAYRAPEGSISAQEFLTKQYFSSLANNEAYAPIANEIRNGSLLKEMASFNIQPLNEDGSINDGMVRRYLDLKAQTITAKQTSVAPEMSAAPTVDYIPVGEQITDLSQAYAVLRQDTQLKASGQAGHPSIAKAEEFIRNSLSKR